MIQRYDIKRHWQADPDTPIGRDDDGRLVMYDAHADAISGLQTDRDSLRLAVQDRDARIAELTALIVGIGRHDAAVARADKAERDLAEMRAKVADRLRGNDVLSLSRADADALPLDLPALLARAERAPAGHWVAVDPEAVAALVRVAMAALACHPMVSGEAEYLCEENDDGDLGHALAAELDVALRALAPKADAGGWG